MTRKYNLGDVVYWCGRRRVVQRIKPSKHGGHCYYGLRLLKDVAKTLPTEYINVGNDGRAERTKIYWVRSDRLSGFEGGAIRSGSPGRPPFQAHRGMTRSGTKSRVDSRYNACVCGKPKLIQSRHCRQCRWRDNPRRVCFVCKGKKTSRAYACRACSAELATNIQTSDIARRLKSGEHVSGLAREYGLTPQRISQIKKRYK